MFLTILNQCSIFIARPKGAAAIRGNATEGANTGSILEGGNHMIGPVGGSIRVNLVGLFRWPHLLLMEARISRAVLV